MKDYQKQAEERAQHYYEQLAQLHWYKSREEASKANERCKTYMHRCDQLNERLESEQKEINHLMGKINEIESMVRDRAQKIEEKDSQIAKLREALTACKNWWYWASDISKKERPSVEAKDIRPLIEQALNETQ